jgi:hypothetical protein
MRATRVATANAYEYSPVPAGPKMRDMTANRAKLKRSVSNREVESQKALVKTFMVSGEAY